MSQHTPTYDGLSSATCMACGSKTISLKLSPLAQAAPDLLAALKGVCRLYELGVDHEAPSVGQALRNAATAIRRAEQGG